MKYLKTFEELSPETYKSASDKLMARGETERAEALSQYIESPFFKHYIDKMRREPGFKEYIDKLKSNPEMKEVISKINPNSDIKQIYTLLKMKDKLVHALEEESIVRFKDFSDDEKKARIMKALKMFGIGTLVATGVAIALIATGHSDIVGLHDIHSVSQMVDAGIASFVTAMATSAVAQIGQAMVPRSKDEEPLSTKD
jgi:hypothetical protein